MGVVDRFVERFLRRTARPSLLGVRELGDPTERRSRDRGATKAPYRFALVQRRRRIAAASRARNRR